MDWFRRKTIEPLSDYELRLSRKDQELEECRRALTEAKERIVNLTFETQVQNAVIHNDNNALASFASIMEEDIPPPPPPLEEFEAPKIPKGAVSVFGSGLASQLANVKLKKKRTPPGQESQQAEPPVVGSKGFVQSLAQLAKEQKQKLASMKPREIQKTTNLEKKKEEAEKRVLELKATRYGVSVEQLKQLMNEASRKNFTLDRFIEDIKRESVRRGISFIELLDERYNKPTVIEQPLKRLKSKPKEKSPSPPKPKTPPPPQPVPVFTIGVGEVKPTKKPKQRGSKRRGSTKKTKASAVPVPGIPEELVEKLAKKFTKASSSRSPSPKSSRSLSSSGSRSRSRSPKSKSSSKSPVKSRSPERTKSSPPRIKPQDLLAQIRQGAKLKKVSPPKKKENIFEKAFSKIKAISPKSPLSEEEREWMSTSQ